MRTELDFAAAVSRGEIPSGSKFANAFYLNLRVSGTGAAYRGQHQEFCYREPSIFLSETMLRRVLGLPVVIGHPAGNVLSAQTFRESVVGTVVFAYVQGTELWGVCRLFDEAIAAQITSGEFEVDTSPAVQFPAGDTSVIKLSDGAALRVEGEPELLDHLAVVPQGVWSKGAPASGVDKSETGVKTNG